MVRSESNTVADVFSRNKVFPKDYIEVEILKSRSTYLPTTTYNKEEISTGIPMPYWGRRLLCRVIKSNTRNSKLNSEIVGSYFLLQPIDTPKKDIPGFYDFSKRAYIKGSKVRVTLKDKDRLKVSYTTGVK